MLKLAVVLLNLGGPASLDEVEPFLRNLFSDPAIVRLPSLLRIPLARWIARRRAPVARAIYARIGGSSPILAETLAQASVLEKSLRNRGSDTRAFVAMRASAPSTEEAVRAVKIWHPDRIVLLPLYPQFSTTTSASSFDAWKKAARDQGLNIQATYVCCYPAETGFIAAQSRLVRAALDRRKSGTNYRVLFSAHGLPKYIAERGDPYAWQVEQTVRAIVSRLNARDLEWKICFQSRVGPLKWLEPATDAEIRLGGTEGKGLIVVPIAFVSEHSETLVELDIEYAKLAAECGVPDYIRVPTVSIAEEFIEGLADLVLKAAGSDETVTSGSGRICPQAMTRCGFRRSTE